MATLVSDGAETTAPSFVRALYSYNGADSAALSFRQGDVIEVLSTQESGWWDGVILQTGTRGWFPSNYVEPISEVEAMWTVRLAEPRLDRRTTPSPRLPSLDEDDFSDALGELISTGESEQLESLPEFLLQRDVDLSSFSTGGDIFGEIAAAALAEYAVDPDPGASSANSAQRGGEEDLWPSLNTRTRDSHADRSSGAHSSAAPTTASAILGGSTRRVSPPASARPQTSMNDDSDDSELDFAVGGTVRRARATNGSTATQDFARIFDLPTSAAPRSTNVAQQSATTPPGEPLLLRDLEAAARLELRQLSDAAGRGCYDRTAREDDTSPVTPDPLAEAPHGMEPAPTASSCQGGLSDPKRVSLHAASASESFGTPNSSDGLVDTSRSHDGASQAQTSATSVRSSIDSDFFFSSAATGELRQALPSSSQSSLADVPISAVGTVRSSAVSRDSLVSGVASLASSGSGVEVLRVAQEVPQGWDDTRRGSAATWSTMSNGSMWSGGAGSHASKDNPRNSTRSSSKNIHKLLGEVPPEAIIRKEAQSVPWYLERDWDDEKLSFTVDHTIRGGTLRGLVIAATSHEGRVDSSYLSAFLMTYRTFCTSHELLDELVRRYVVLEPVGISPSERKEWEAKKQRPIRARVTNLLKAWVREYMDQEDLDRALLNRIREFALTTMTEKGQALQICKSVDERMQGAARRPIGNLAPGPLPSPIVPRNLKKLKLVDLDTLELARQLTIMDSRLFQRITAQECLSKAWPKQFATDAPNVSAMIEMSNAVTRWVTESILAQDDLKKRVAVVKHFVAVAERCLALNNFSTLIHILAGLNSTPIHRLRRTWEIVNQKTMMTLAMLNHVMKPDKNYKEYRDVLRKSAPPCVPFLGVYLTDWTFIGDGNPDILRERPHQINFNKRQKASELILMIKLHQATTYNLQAVPAIATFLQDALFPPGIDNTRADQRLYEKSLQVEPRERDDEKIARLLSESGFL
ncbi:hypothetical protein JCM3774_002009 [Rhodotorula dairenensis]